MPLCSFKTASGVTQIEFSPCGRKLYTAVRRNEEFLCWDLRNPGQVLCSFEERKSDTNQRIQFHALWNDDTIVSGLLNRVHSYRNYLMTFQQGVLMDASPFGKKIPNQNLILNYLMIVSMESMSIQIYLY